MTRQILRMLESVDLEKSTCNCGNPDCNICNPKKCNVNEE